MIPVTRPYLPALEKYMSYVERAFEDEWLTNFGPLHEELQARLRDYLGVRHLLLVANGTLALQIAIRALELEGEVVTTPFTFVATSSALKWQSLIPRYADIGPRDCNIDPILVKRMISPRTSAIMPVHVYGAPCDTCALDAIGAERRLRVIYDASHAFGVRVNGHSLLKAGDVSTLSFHATKLFHTAEGGAIVFRKAQDFDRARRLINFGFDEGGHIVDVGINAKMSELHAAMGLAVLDSISDIIAKRLELVEEYERCLDGCVVLQQCPPDVSRNGAYMPILLASAMQRDSVWSRLDQEGIETRRYFSPALHDTDVYRSGDVCPVASDVVRSVLCLPLYTDLTRQQVRWISELVKQALS